MSDDAPDLFVDLDRIDPAVVFANGGAAVVIAEIEAKARAVAMADLSTATARGAIAAVAYKVARTKTALDDKGKDHVAELKKQAKAVDAERKAIRDSLDALKDEVRKPLTDWEEAENRRIEELQTALAEIEALAAFENPEPSAAEIGERLDRLPRLGGNRDWQEFDKRAAAAREKAQTVLAALLETAKRREAERAELEALRQKEAERADHERIAKAAEEHTRKVQLEAEAKAAAERADAQRQIEEANARAERAAEDERKRIQALQDKADAEKRARENDRAHRAQINGVVRDKLMEHAALSKDQAVAVVTAMARGQIENVTINY